VIKVLFVHRFYYFQTQQAAEQSFQTFQLQLLSKQNDLESQLAAKQEELERELDEKNSLFFKLRESENKLREQVSTLSCVQ